MTAEGTYADWLQINIAVLFFYLQERKVQSLKQTICKAIAKEVSSMTEAGVTASAIGELVETPPEKELGDFALPCFSFAKVLYKSPRVIAEELKEKLMNVQGIQRIEAVNGYLNFYLDREGYAGKVIEKITGINNGVVKRGEGKVICIDYSSPNIAKNFHVGHLRTTIIGNSLYQIYKKLGYQVVRINYLGDWGTQFGKLIVAYQKWSSKEAVEKDGIDELLRIYVKFNEESEQDGKLIDEARHWFVKMEQNDEEALEIWNWFKQISMVEFKRVYEMLGISFDSYAGESFYRDKVSALVEELEQKKLLQDSQGAKVIDLSAYGMPPCLIVKSDGGSIYHSRDIAAVLYRKQTYHFDQCLYVTGLEQTLHFKQIFKAIELMGYDWYTNLKHIPYGLVSLDGQKLSSRKGNIIYAEDILKEATNRALDSINAKNPELADKEKIAKQIGVGAVIFHDLFNQRIKNIDFVWEEVLSFEGTTGPYVQYTYARAKSILRKCSWGMTTDVRSDTADKPLEVSTAYLTDDVSFELLKTLNGYEAAVQEAAERYEPSVIARYLIRVTTNFNKFYHECPILQAEKPCRKARLLLVDMTQTIIADACRLLGMECPEEM